MKTQMRKIIGLARVTGGIIIVRLWISACFGLGWICLLFYLNFNFCVYEYYMCLA